MKKIVICVVSFFIFSTIYGQSTKDTNEILKSDCSQLISIKTDKMTGNTTTSSKNTILVSKDGGKTGFGIFLLLSEKGSVSISIQAVGASRCIDENSEINILFEDNSKIAISNSAKFNCKNKAVIYLGGVFGGKKQLQELKTKKIQTMRVWTHDGFVEKDFSEENKDDFINSLNCLIK